MSGIRREERKRSWLGLAQTGRLKKIRPFETAECKACQLKGSRYCWRQCPYNRWRQQQIE
jgi:sulfatase maturation enzyme AslB (radical SAM superfamily)